MKNLAEDSIRATYMKLDSNNKPYTFELYGLDFMIDVNFKPWLIEINTNPCLETSGAVLSRIIPNLIEQVFRIAIDPIYPPPIVWPKSRRYTIPEFLFENNKFELIFDNQHDKDENLEKHMNDNGYIIDLK